MVADLAVTRMDPTREQALVARSRVDAAAFGELYDYYLPRIYAFVARRVVLRPREAAFLRVAFFLVAFFFEAFFVPFFFDAFFLAAMVVLSCSKIRSESGAGVMPPACMLGYRRFPANTVSRGICTVDIFFCPLAPARGDRSRADRASGGGAKDDASESARETLRAVSTTR